VLQERITTRGYGVDGTHRFRNFLFMNAMQTMMGALIALVPLTLLKDPRDKHSGWQWPSKPLLREYLEVGMPYALGAPLSYWALKFIDYPTIILAKSCKLVPLMLMHTLWHRRLFPWRKYFVVVLVTWGVSNFMLLHQDFSSKKARHVAQNSLLGLALVLANLLVDGYVNSCQDQLFRRHPKQVTPYRMMFFINVIGTAMVLGWILCVQSCTGELQQAISFFYTYPVVLRDIALFGLCGGLGQIFIYQTLRTYGSVLLVTVNITRKMLTILLSVVWFQHQLTLGQWGAVGMVFAGILLEAAYK